MLDEKILGWVGWCNRNEVSVRRDREVREALLGRVRLFPLGNYDINIATNFPVQAFGASLHVLSAFRFVMMTEPTLLEPDKLYAHNLLDRDWVTARIAEGFDKWHAPVFLIINGHDSWTVECDEEDAPRVAQLLESAMTHKITAGGVTMDFPAEPAIGRRLSDT